MYAYGVTLWEMLVGRDPRKELLRQLGGLAQHQHTMLREEAARLGVRAADPDEMALLAQFLGCIGLDQEVTYPAALLRWMWG